MDDEYLDLLDISGYHGISADWREGYDAALKDKQPRKPWPKRFYHENAILLCDACEKLNESYDKMMDLHSEYLRIKDYRYETKRWYHDILAQFWNGLWGKKNDGAECPDIGTVRVATQSYMATIEREKQTFNQYLENKRHYFKVREEYVALQKTTCKEPGAFTEEGSWWLDRNLRPQLWCPYYGNYTPSSVVKQR